MTRRAFPEKPTPVVLHAGACRAVKILGPCTCPGYEPGGQVAGYSQCVCGHTQQSHALIETSPETAPAVQPGRAA